MSGQGFFDTFGGSVDNATHRRFSSRASRSTQNSPLDNPSSSKVDQSTLFSGTDTSHFQASSRSIASEPSESFLGSSRFAQSTHARNRFSSERHCPSATSGDASQNASEQDNELSSDSVDEQDELAMGQDIQQAFSTYRGSNPFYVVTIPFSCTLTHFRFAFPFDRMRFKAFQSMRMIAVRWWML